MKQIATVILLGAGSTVVGAAAMTWIITGSGDPNVWVSAYAHAMQCAVADPALSAKCHTIAAVPAVEVHAPERSAPASTPPSAEAPPAEPAAVPAAHATAEDHDDEFETTDS